MAKLIDSPKEWEQRDKEDFMEYIRRIDKIADGIESQNKLIKFSVADGYACYEVVEEKPLTIRHIPVADRYKIPAAHIRGLTLKDVIVQRNFYKLFR